ncbi:MAG: DegT/DnrJ/EryC1/StrS family aminotransferase [Pseudomonadota bacterium]|nr:DegT/DnrJ/EryC1/StrS family aminotransferase [Pseudomonadota bacterium]
MSNDQLAILGGTPVLDGQFPRYSTIGGAEKSAVMSVLDSGELSGFIASPGKEFNGGPAVQALEAQFRERFGVKHAVAVNSATSGLHCAAAALDLGPGDEVIVPPYTMTATSTVVVMMGAVPVFADIEDRTFCLDPESVEAQISSQTKAIFAVNLFGHPARLKELRAIAEKHDLFLLEDNAQSPAGLYQNRYTGTIGDVGVFSFNRHKTMQCGEGGMIVTDDDRIARKAAYFRNHGEGVVEALGETDIVNTLGLNYRMTEMEAAVAGVQFRRLDELNDARIKLANRLSKNLSEFEGITPPAVEEGCKHVYYFHVSKFDPEVAGTRRDTFVKALTAEGFPVRAGYVKPVYREPMFQQKIALGRGGFPWSSHPRDVSYDPKQFSTVERLNASEVFLTHLIYPPLTENDMDLFGEAVGKVMANKDALRSLEDEN